LEGKENLTWSGVLELYWTDARLDGCPRSNKLPENIWRPRMTGSVGFSLGDAEKGTKLPTFNDSRKEKTPDGGRISNGKLQLKASFELGNGGLNLSNHLKRFRAFPYDSTRVDVMVQFYTGNDERPGSTGLDLQFNRPNVKTRLKDGACQHIDWLATRHCDDFALKAVGYALGSNHVNVWGNPAGSRPCLCLSLHIARTPAFYEQKGILPLYAAVHKSNFAASPTHWLICAQVCGSRVRAAVLLRPGADRSTLADLDHGGSLPDGLRDSMDRHRTAAAAAVLHYFRHSGSVRHRGTHDVTRRCLC